MTRKSVITTVLVLLAVALLGVGVVLAYDAFRTRKIDSYAITYEVTVEGAGGIRKVEYTAVPDGQHRTADPTTRTDEAPTATPWSRDVIIPAGRQARLVVTPAQDAVVGCKIVLDKDLGSPKTKTLTENKAPAVGQPITCSATLDDDARFGR
ncbi:hypothetical protein [Actinokineospora sp.]|uniref:hypothetical protein n=1 Tax=Actinokineospora sp. TaxID=1872133 RepID=UPI003D6C673A